MTRGCTGASHATQSARRSVRTPHSQSLVSTDSLRVSTFKLAISTALACGVRIILENVTGLLYTYVNCYGDYVTHWCLN